MKLPTLSHALQLLVIACCLSCEGVLIVGPALGAGGAGVASGGSAGSLTTGAGGSVTAAGSGGITGTGSGGTAGIPVPAAPAPAPATVRRLTKSQLANTVQAVLGVTSTSLARLGADVRGSHGYENSVQGTAFTFDDAKAYFSFVEEVAFERIVPATVAGCSLTATAGEQCIRTFLEGKAGRLLRRPLTAQEITTAVQVYSSVARTAAGPDQAFRVVVSHLLMSPHFQYRTEFGGMSAPGTTPVSLSSFEMASALSYLLWNSSPDDELFAAAASGALADPAQVKAQVVRMLRSPLAQRFADAFTNGYLVLIEAQKDSAVFPRYNSTIAKALIEQTTLWMRQFILSPSATFSQMLTSNQVMASAATASWYGLGTTGLNATPQLVPADAQTRGGFLTQPAFIGSRTHAARTSPVHMGEFIANNLLCVHLGAPPLNAATVDGMLPANATQRQRSAARLANANCAGCHRVMDPLGLPFEGYDPTGALTTTPALDLSSTVVGSLDLDGPVSGPVDLSRRLSASPSVHTCFAKHMFRYLNGRYEKDDEELLIERTGEQFYGTNRGNIEQLVTAIIQQETFSKRSRP